MVETRRERVRAATTQEIVDSARRILVTEGREAVSLRAIARDMGMTAPALYRYFDGHENLIKHLCHVFQDELATVIEGEVGLIAGKDAGERLVVACRAFRRWSLDHPNEYGLLFGSPLPGVFRTPMPKDAEAMTAHRFAAVFLMLFVELWRTRPFRLPEEVDPRLIAQLTSFQQGFGGELPIECLVVFLDCWVRLQGIVSLEVFGHLRFALTDAEPMFEMTLADLRERLGA
ncbi:TetR/AcrR family transcriptional regulator [Streptosporangiaceae bacterium NEAU-GS5]|nr:TetR/AcrR family transcriptional regulator [Streptosporangiaceae bacterium NEAU-GS5]